jgi:hypothetical protein
MFAISIILIFVFGVVATFELKEWKDKAFRNSSIGFAIALSISFYVGVNYLGHYGLWPYLVKLSNLGLDSAYY